MKKKMLAILLTAVTALSMLSGCGEKETGESGSLAAAGTERGAGGNGAADAGSGAGESGAVNPDAVITVATTGGWDSLNPLASTTQSADFVVNTIFENLVAMDENGELIPRLAQSWEVSEDHTSATFHLAENAMWTDGEPVTADDVVFTAMLLAKPELTTSRRLLMQQVAGTDSTGVELSAGSAEVTKVDDHTVTFQFKVPMTIETFFSEYSSFFVLPEHLLKDVSVSSIMEDDFWVNPVGCGPFIFDSQTPGETLTLRANPDYYLGEIQFGTLVIRKVAADGLLAAVMSGEVDLLPAGIASLPNADYDACSALENVTTLSIPACSFDYLAVNNKQLSDPRVRRGLAMLIDKESLIQAVYGGRANRMDVNYGMENKWYNADIVEEYGVKYDPEGGKALLEEAGFDFTQTLKIVVTSGSSNRRQEAVLIQQAFAQAGVNLEIQEADMATEMQMMRDGEATFSTMGGGGMPPSKTDDHVNFYVTEGAFNLSGLTDTTYEELYNKIGAALTEEEIRQYADELQQRECEEIPYLYLMSPNATVVYNNRLNGINGAELNLRTFSYTDWYVTE